MTSSARQQSTRTRREAGGTLDGASLKGGTVEFSSGSITSGIVKLDKGSELIFDENTFTGSIKDFRGTDFMDLQDLKFFAAGANETTATWTQKDAAGGTLKVKSGTHSADIHLLGQYVTANFAVQSDGIGGTTVVYQPASDSSHATLASPHHG
jgi:hypothetical protein